VRDLALGIEAAKEASVARLPIGLQHRARLGDAHEALERARDDEVRVIGSPWEIGISLSHARSRRERIHVRREREAALPVHEDRDRERVLQARCLEALGFIEIEIAREREQTRRAAKEALPVEPEAKEPPLERLAAEVVLAAASGLAQRDRAHEVEESGLGALGFVEAELHREAADREGAKAREASKAPKPSGVSARAVAAGRSPELARRIAMKGARDVRAGGRKRIVEGPHAPKGVHRSNWVENRGMSDRDVARGRDNEVPNHVRRPVPGAVGRSSRAPSQRAGFEAT